MVLTPFFSLRAVKLNFQSCKKHFKRLIFCSTGKFSLRNKFPDIKCDAICSIFYQGELAFSVIVSCMHAHYEKKHECISVFENMFSYHSRSKSAPFNSSVHLFVSPCIHSFVRVFICSFFCLFVHLFVAPFVKHQILQIN